jgi:hypothetical protein
MPKRQESKGEFIMADMVKVRSATDVTVSLFDPTIPLRKTWEKRGAIIPIERDKLIQAYYNSSLESCLRNGTLVIDDKGFLYEVGFIAEENAKVPTFEMTKTIMDKMIETMPVWELEKTLKMLSDTQIAELAEYAVTNHAKLKMDRLDVLSKYSRKNILKAIELYKASQED